MLGGSFSDVCVPSASGGSGINVDALPLLPDPDELEARVRDMAGAGAEFHHGVQDAARNWSGLETAYRTQESDQVLGAFTSVLARSDQVQDLTARAARVLNAYADRARDIKHRITWLRAEVQALDAIILANDDWQSKNSIVGDHQAALDKASALAQAILDSDTQCANDLSALVGGGPYTAAHIPRRDKFTSTDPVSNGFTVLQHYLGTDTTIPDLPWGRTVSIRHEGPLSSVQGFATAAAGAVEGLYTLAGTTDKNQQTHAWQGAGALGQAVFTTTAVIARGFTDMTGQDIEAILTTAAVVKDTVHYEEWGTDPWRAGGQTLFDVGSLPAGGVPAIDARIAVLAAKLRNTPASTTVLPEAGTALTTTGKTGTALGDTTAKVNTLIAPAKATVWMANLDTAIAKIDAHLAAISKTLRDYAPNPATAGAPAHAVPSPPESRPITRWRNEHHNTEPGSTATAPQARPKGLWSEELRNTTPAEGASAESINVVEHTPDTLGHPEKGPTPHPDDPPTPLDQLYGKPTTRHAEHAAYPEATDINRRTMETVSDPNAPWGRFDGGRGEPMAKGDYDKRYTLLTESGKYRDNYPPNAGAVRGTRRDYSSMKGFILEYGHKLDRIGDESGKYLGVMKDGKAASFEERSLPVDALNLKYAEYRWAEEWPPGAEGWKIEISRIAPAFGRKGGGLQVAVRDKSGAVQRIDKLISMGVLS